MPKVWQPDSRKPTGGFMKEQGKDAAGGGSSGREGEVNDLGAVARAKGRTKSAEGESNPGQSPAEEQDLAEMTPIAAAAERARRKRLKGLAEGLATSPSRK